MPRTSESIIINAPLKKVYDTVTDFKGYPKVFDEVSKACVLKKGKNTMEVEFEFQVLMKISCILKFHLSKEVSWELVKGDFMRSNNGSWKFEEKSPKKTKATYTVDITPSMFVPNVVIDGLIKNNAPLMLKNLKKKCEKKNRY